MGRDNVTTLVALFFFLLGRAESAGFQAKGGLPALRTGCPGVDGLGRGPERKGAMVWRIMRMGREDGVNDRETKMRSASRGASRRDRL